MAAPSRVAMTRARMSVLPPGVKGTTRRTGLPWARGSEAGSTQASRAGINSVRRCMVQAFVVGAAVSQLWGAASLPATEYSAPGALRVFWKSSSDCPRMAA